MPSERAGEVVSKRRCWPALGIPLLDARGRPRFEGSEADPRPGVAAGHIPGARNLPFATLYNEDGTFKSREEIRRLFDRCRRRPGATVRRQLRLRRDRQFA